MPRIRQEQSSSAATTAGDFGIVHPDLSSEVLYEALSLKEMVRTRACAETDNRADIGSKCENAICRQLL